MNEKNGVLNHDSSFILSFFLICGLWELGTGFMESTTSMISILFPLSATTSSNQLPDKSYQREQNMLKRRTSKRAAATIDGIFVQPMLQLLFAIEATLWLLCTVLWLAGRSISAFTTRMCFRRTQYTMKNLEGRNKNRKRYLAKMPA